LTEVLYLWSIFSLWISTLKSEELGECRTLRGERERAAQWLRKVAEFEQGQTRFCHHNVTHARLISNSSAYVLTFP